MRITKEGYSTTMNLNSKKTLIGQLKCMDILGTNMTSNEVLFKLLANLNPLQVTKKIKDRKNYYNKLNKLKI